MQVETYEIEEQDETTAPEAIEEEAKALVEELGLSGQQSLTHTHADGVTERVPYPKMTQEEAVVYRTLFPTETPVEKYEGGIIPVRVLQVVKHCRDLGLTLVVWHSPQYQPDPVLVGKLGTNTLFRLARWGSALAPYKKLLGEARESLKRSLKRQAMDTVARGQIVLNDLDGHVEKKLCGEWFYL